MPSNEEPPGTEPPGTEPSGQARGGKSARRTKTLLVLTGVALAGLTLISWTQVWFTLSLAGTSTAARTIAVGGDTAAPALATLSLAGLALVGALTLAGKLFRRILGVLEVLIGLSIVLSAVSALADPIRASAELVTKATGVSGTKSVGQLVTAITQSPWPWIALFLGIGIGVLGAALVFIGRAWPGSSARFRSAPLRGTAGSPAPASDWDAMTDGGDPTSR